jgi:ribose/xylose/arabinose/galactoside ABC-type transport system permease subunit
MSGDKINNKKNILHEKNKKTGDITNIKRQSMAWRILSQNSIWVVFIVLCVIMAFASPTFFTFVNFRNLLTTESIKGIMAIGVMFCILSRGIDLSTAGVLALSSVVSASLVQEIDATNRIIEGGAPVFPLVAVLAGVLVGAIFGCINGSLIAFTKIPPFIATLGSMLVTRALAMAYTNAVPVPSLTPGFRAIGGGSLIFGIPNVVLAFVLVVCVAAFLLTQTRYGKSVYAIGGNEMAARVAGINVEKTLVKVYMWSSTCAALAGVLLASRVGAGNATLGTNFELDAIAMATVGGVSHSGGVARMTGVIAGILLLSVVNNGMLLLGLAAYWQPAVQGIIIVGAVVFDMRKVARKA